MDRSGGELGPENTFARPEPLNLKPIDVKVPDGADPPIHRLLESYFASRGVKSPDAVGDGVYCRRVYLDTIGLFPTAEQFN